MIDRYVINVSSRKSEMEWGDTRDDFYSRVVPTAFKWTSWALLLGGLKSVGQTTGSETISGVRILLFIGFMMHALFVLSRVVIIWGDDWTVDGRAFRLREKLVTLLVIVPLFYLFLFVANRTSDAILAMQSVEVAESQEAQQ